MAFFVTTPIYYVNDAPHIGHAYTTILADVLNRYKLLFGEETFFLTGTDEHGQKVEASAKSRGLEPQAHCDEYVKRFQNIWEELSIEPDFFIRTTMDFHKQVVKDCLQELFDKGEIYQDEYEGWYSESEEMFYTEDELVDGKSPMGKEVTKIREKNYFFKMSKYYDRLVKHVEDNPDFIQPKGKRSEVLGMLKEPLGDLCISRPKSRLTWGIELPFDQNFVTYVWFDALLNYPSALGYKQKDDSNFKKFWPNTTHLIGKDILMTHCLYWPTMLMALGVELPKQIFAHGWWLTADDTKMSKSEGEVVSPLEMKDIVGVYGLRYFLMRGMSPARDGQFSKELVLTKVNAELSNNLGNLLSRSIGLVAKHFDAKLPDVEPKLNESKELIELAIQTKEKVRASIDEIQPNIAIQHVVDLLSETNKYIDGQAPWKLLKAGEKEQAAESLYVALDILRIVGILLHPVMPDKTTELLKRVGFNNEINFEDAGKFGVLKAGDEVIKGEPLFPRVEDVSKT